MEKIKLQTGSNQNCDIFVTHNLSHTPTFFQEYIAPTRRYMAVIDEKVEQLYGDLFPFEKIIFQADETNKSWTIAGEIIQQLIEKQADKDIFLLGIGGGITTDITGFVASIYKRGVDFGFIPTTLLAMIDAAIGGKNGLNILEFKNMVGTIRQPQWIYANTSFLKTFSKDKLYQGIPEMLKVFLIDGNDYFAAADFFIRQYNGELFATEEEVQQWIYFITKAIEIKCGFVRQDETDGGSRRLLNLGHTYAHAIEHCTQQYTHGEAVGIGLIFAAQQGDFPHLNHLIHTLQSCHLPCSLPTNLTIKDLHAAMLQDKKIKNQRIPFIILKDVGNVTFAEKQL